MHAAGLSGRVGRLVAVDWGVGGVCAVWLSGVVWVAAGLASAMVGKGLVVGVGGDVGVTGGGVRVGSPESLPAFG